MERLLLLALGLFIAARLQRPKPVDTNGGDFNQFNQPTQLRPGGGGTSQSQGSGNPNQGPKSDNPQQSGGFDPRGMV